MDELLEPLDKAISEKLLPAITGISTISPELRSIFGLPTRSGGLGMPKLGDSAEEEFQTSLQMTAPLAAIMASQRHQLPDQEEVSDARSLAGATKLMRSKQLVAAVEDSLASEMAECPPP